MFFCHKKIKKFLSLWKNKGRDYFYNEYLDPNDRIWTIYLQNISEERQKVVLFNSLLDPYNKRWNGNVKVLVSESSYEAIKTDLLSSVFFACHLKSICTNEKQFDNPIMLCEGRSTGSINKRRLLLTNYRVTTVPGQNPHIIEVPGPMKNEHILTLSKYSYWEFELEPKTEITFCLEFFAEINPRRTCVLKEFIKTSK